MNTTYKALVFDMDGTIADLYGVKGWLDDLMNEDTRPYDIAEPMYDMDELGQMLIMAKEKGWTIIVTTWLARNSSKEYKKATSEAKKNWLAKYNFPYDEIHCVQYGTTKANCTRKNGGFQILIDDNKKVRNGWKLGTTIDATQDIRNFLKALI